MLVDESVQAAEKHALPPQLGRKVRFDWTAVDAYGSARQIDTRG